MIYFRLDATSGLFMKSTVFTFLLLLTLTTLRGQSYTADIQEFYTSVRNNDVGASTVMVKKLAAVDENKLKEHLNTHQKALSFWINTYNIFVQYILKEKPALFKDRSEFFSSKLITVAGQSLSLDDIEHGIIRGSKNKYSLGYLGAFGVSEFEKKFRLEKTDYRVHFALNCGAKSCPPVALYVADRIDEQLDKSTAAYLKANTKFNKQQDEVFVPKLCFWFKADFGGEQGVLDMLHKYKIIPNEKSLEVEYLDYNWDLSLSNYIDL
jgi:hypothetical protein